MKASLRSKIPSIIVVVLVAVVLIVSLVVINKPAESITVTRPVSTAQNLDQAHQELSSHATKNDCWLEIEGEVYDVTSYVSLHPGGESAITGACGADATDLFTTSKGRKHSSTAHSLLAQMKVTQQDSTQGTNSQTQNPPTPAPTQNPTTPSPSSQTLTTELISTHNSNSDCWLVINNNVYDVTSYIPSHPGGQQRIINACGKDATSLFTTNAGRKHSSFANNLLNNYYIGALGQASVPLTDTPVIPPGNYDDDDDDDDDEEDDDDD